MSVSSELGSCGCGTGPGLLEFVALLILCQRVGLVLLVGAEVDIDRGEDGCLWTEIPVTEGDNGFMGIGFEKSLCNGPDAGSDDLDEGEPAVERSSVPEDKLWSAEP